MSSNPRPAASAPQRLIPLKSLINLRDFPGKFK
jgi:hypothetical protein